MHKYCNLIPNIAYLKCILTFLFVLSALICTAQEGVDSTETIYPQPDPHIIITQQDTILIDSINKPKGKLKDVLIYDSKDRILKLKENKAYLIENAFVQYGDMEIKADFIEIDWNTHKILAQCKRDSLGLCKSKTTFTQDGQTLEYAMFEFDYERQIGIAYNVRIEDGIPEGVMVAEKVKKVDEQTYYMQGIFFTPDPEFIAKRSNEPDFYIVSPYAKYVNEKVIITDRVQAYIEGIPTPLMLPFGIFPTSSKKANAGIIIPSFGEREDTGFYLEGLGVYIPFGDYLDLKTTIDLYTQGSWATHLESNYKKRYKFSGGIGFDYEKNKIGTKGLPSYSENNYLRLFWRHTQDAKSNPNLSLSANVNYASTEYFRNTYYSGNYTSGNVLTNTISSSVSLTKRFDNLPFQMNLSAAHSQNSNTNAVTMTLPRLNVSMDRLYPFKRKTGSKKGLVQNIAIDYTLDAEARFNTYDSLFFKNQMWEDMRSGLRNQLDIQTGMTLAKFFPITFSANYQDVWYPNTIQKVYNPNTDQVDDVTQSGIKSFRDFSLSTSISTNLYLTKYFNKKNKSSMIQAFRHVMTPSVSYSFTPDFSNDFWGYYDTYREGDGTLELYSPFENGIYGYPQNGLSNNINLSLSNNIELKVRDRKNDSVGFKKIKIFDYLTLGSSYNLAADSLNLSPLTVSGSTKLLQGKVSLNFGAIFDMYNYAPSAYNDEGVAIAYTRVDDLGAPRFTSWRIGATYSMNNTTFSKKGATENKTSYPYRGSVRNSIFEYDEDHYAHFDIPWSLNFSLNHAISRPYEQINRTTSLNVNGSLSPTPYWSINFTSNYDIEANEMAYTTLNLSRDLRSFNLTFSWVPFGSYQTWNFFIGLKANLLRDIKYDDSSSYRLNNSNAGF